MGVMKSWADYLHSMKAQKAKKKERIETVMKQFGAQNEQLQIVLLQSWSGFMRERRARIEHITNNFIAEGNMLLQLMVQNWAHDTKAEVAAKGNEGKGDEAEHAARAREKEERVRA